MGYVVEGKVKFNARVRVLADVDYAPVPLMPRLSPLSGEELDMSLCVLRSSGLYQIVGVSRIGSAPALPDSRCPNGSRASTSSPERSWPRPSCTSAALRVSDGPAVPLPVRPLARVIGALRASQ